VEKQVSGFKALNEARKDQTDREAQMAEELAQAYTQRKAIVIHSDSFSDGIVGITAGRLKERHWKPAIVLASTPSGTLKGSGRSIDGFHLKHALDQCADLLLGYGGHAKAVGLSLLPEHLDAFVERFCRLAEESLTEEALVKKTPLDAVLQEQDVTADLLHALRQLEPYGEGFPEPLFGLTASPNRVSYMGVEKNHVKLHCPQSGLALIGWGKAEQIQAMQARTGALPQKFIGRPSLNVWNGVAYPQFICQELRRR
jgi:single-stranded-DNA-specific exonuclease